MFSKILVPVDGSENSFRAFEQAVFIAKSTGAQLTAMHVVESPPTVYVESQKLLNDLLSNYKKESAKILDKFEEIAEKNEIKIETVIAEGDPASNITRYAQNGDFELIVIGSKGLGGLKEMMLGSTSSKVLHHTKAAVLVVR